MGGKGEGTGNGVPPCPPPLKYMVLLKKEKVIYCRFD